MRHCGETTDIFGRGGGRSASRLRTGSTFLGGIPLDVSLRQGADVGVPAVAQRDRGRGEGSQPHRPAIAGKVSVEAAREQPVLTVS